MEKDKNLIKCPFCGEHINKHNTHHYKKCRDEYIDSLSDIKKEEIKRLYVDEGKSLVQLSKILNLPYMQLQILLPKLGITLRHLNEACNMPDKKRLYENAVMEHFGTKHNFCKECSSRKEWEERLLKEEGITNVFQREDVKNKIKNTMLKKYGEKGIYYNHAKGSFLEYWIEKLGIEEGIKKYNEICAKKGNSSRVEYYIEKYGEEIGMSLFSKRLEKLNCKNSTKISGLNKIAYGILEKNNIEYEKEFHMYYNHKNYWYDIRINKLIIELNGLYWHCSPKKYHENDILTFSNGKEILVKDRWNYDKIKNESAELCGFKVAVIWEDELNEKILMETIKKYNYGNC